MGKYSDFDRNFLLRHLMGPNCVLQAEELTAEIELPPETRILDLGCGNGLTSIFLARKYKAQIVAADLWVDPTDNFGRFQMFGLEDRIIPIRTEAHALPFAREYFDAVVSVGAYNYFGAVPGYLDTHLVPLVKKGGIIAVAVPGLKKELDDGVPEELKPFWQDDFHFYSPTWWRSFWRQSPHLEVQKSFSLACHAQAWNDWLQTDNPYAVGDRPMMTAENGKYYDTVGIIAKVAGHESHAPTGLNFQKLNQ